MSYQIAIDTIHLRPTPRLAHIEYNDHPGIVRWAFEKKYGRKCQPDDGRAAQEAFEEYAVMDMAWCTLDGLIGWDRGRSTDMGHAVYMEGGVDKREPKQCPWESPEQIYAEFDACEEYGMPDFDEQVAAYEKSYQERRAAKPEVLQTGGYYKTVVSGAIQAFGWDMLLMAAADQEKFDRVLESIFQRTLFFVKAWAQTSIEVFIQHDDMVWSQGAFMHPDFYRSAIFPRYAQLWKVLHDAGKKILFCSDADFTEFLEDIAGAGADGFIFEPMTSPERAVRLFGKTHVIVSSKVDCRTMTFGTKDDVKAEIDASLALAKGCPGFMFAVGNHIPENIPLENLIFYFDYLKAHWQRP